MAVIEPKNARLHIERFDYRIVFAKKGRAVYISHLDMMRAFQRIIKRAKLPVWHTQGFNPHVYIMFPLPLSLGLESCCEVMDIALIEKLECDEVRDRLNANMPEGFEALRVYPPDKKHLEIASSVYEVRLTTDRKAEEAEALFDEFLSQDVIEIEKRTKKKDVKLVDIKPHITLLDKCVRDGALCLTLRLPSGNDFNLNLNVVIDAYTAATGQTLDEFYAMRTKILTKSGESFT